ncbi:MAG: hypothetical protein ACREN8_12620 [Candidatus Dormibacteraceae bacterium]
MDSLGSFGGSDLINQMGLGQLGLGSMGGGRGFDFSSFSPVMMLLKVLI